MIRLVLLIAVLAVYCTATIYDEDVAYKEDYEDYEDVEDEEDADIREEESMADETEDSASETKNWQDFSMTDSLNISVNMSDIERYFVRFPCSEKIRFTLHLMGENETNSYVEFVDKTKGNIFCNKARTQRFGGGSKKKFEILDSAWKCEDDGQFMILEVEKTSKYVAFKNRRNTLYYTLYTKAFGSNVGNCYKKTERIITDVRKYNNRLLSLAFSSSSIAGLRQFESKVDGLNQEILTNVAGKSLSEVKSYANSTDGSLTILQWWLMKHIQDNEKLLHFGDETLGWILANREALEMFMTSGDVAHNRYWEALMIFRKLIQEDPGIKKEPLRLRLAVATSLTHSTPVKSMAIKGKKIDWMYRYQTYMKWSQEGILYPQFFEGTAWHLRYVVGSWQTEEEHIWARENTPEGKDNPSKIGLTLGMVPYTNPNKDGQRVGQRSSYYYFQPETLKVMHEIGGVCGAISKFAAGMCHAYGVPATPVGQPGHCAYIWYTNGTWTLANRIRGWGQSRTHAGIQYTWQRPAYYFRIMDKAQKNLESYRLSEKMRVASMLANPGDRFEILEDATTECPHNYDVWMDLEGAIKEPNLQALLPIVLAQREKDKEVSDIALGKAVTSECFGDTAVKLTDTTDEIAYCEQETGDFELDLGKPSTINAVKFQPWRKARPMEYDIYAMSEEGNYVLVKTEKDEREEDHWRYLDGWDMKTTKIKVDLKKGRLTPFRKTSIYFGIKRFKVIGISYDVIDDVSKGRPVTANPDSSDPTSLVDANNPTLWKGNSENSWFEIDLKQICALDDIELFWADGARPEKVIVTYKVGTDQETQASATNPFDKVPLQMNCGTTVKVEMSGGSHVLRGVKACGTAYRAKDILKMKLDMVLEDYEYVRKDLKESIDRMEYED